MFRVSRSAFRVLRSVFRVPRSVLRVRVYLWDVDIFFEGMGLLISE